MIAVYKRLKILSIAGVMLLSGVLSATLPAAQVNADTVSPEPTPEECFDFQAETGTVIRYGDPNRWYTITEVCTADIVIPAQISDTDVRIIGEGAFNSTWCNQTWESRDYESGCIRSVVIPDGVESIGAHAFSSQMITSLDIPGSVARIGAHAFRNNRIDQLTLNEGLETIGSDAFFGNELREAVLPTTLQDTVDMTFVWGTPGNSVFGTQGEGARQFLYEVDTEGAGVVWAGYRDDPEWALYFQSILDKSYYLKLYLADPSNPRGFQDNANIGVYADWETPEPLGYYVLGGDLIMPASTHINYESSDGTTLAPDLTQVGKLPDGTIIHDYMTKNGPDFVVQLPESWETGYPTFDRASALSAYHRIGDTITIDAPVISGIQPNPSSYTMVLGASATANERTFVYGNNAPAEPVSPVTPADPANPVSGAGGAPSGDGNLADTGSSLVALVAIATLAVMGGLYGVSRQFVRR